MNRAVLFLGLALVAGCEHKKEEPATKPASGAGGTTAAKTTSDLPAEPVGREATTKPAGGGGDGDVRAPVAADLADYTKDIKGQGKLFAAIETSMGTFHCELFADKTPMTVANFVGLATGKKSWQNPKTGSVETGKPFFDGIIFHRVIPEFMVQTGDPLGRGTGGPGYAFADEFVPDLKFKAGSLAMANSGPATNGSQFFITEVETTHLNGKHTIFGQCKEVELVKQITGVPKSNDRPDSPITINHVTFSRAASW